MGTDDHLAKTSSSVDDYPTTNWSHILAAKDSDSAAAQAALERLCQPYHLVSGIRLLGVATKYRRLGAGAALPNACIELARKRGHSQVVLHTTQAMQVAWRLYEKLGFQRSEDLDFMQESLPVLGFRLQLK